ncbi:MAG TPA: zf-HC2 domain-containing protein [Trebonia sp.]|nr:zf-HC2 domain-containing protein [Trebonia sp.]
MGQDCARWHDDLGAYTLGALDAKDSAAMRAHLAGCAACRADYEYLLPVRNWLARTRQHLATCRACRSDYQDLLHLRLLPASPPAGTRPRGALGALGAEGRPAVLNLRRSSDAAAWALDRI